MHFTAIASLFVLCHVIDDVTGHAGSEHIYKTPRDDLIITRSGKMCVQQFKIDDRVYTNECTKEGSVEFWCPTSKYYTSGSSYWDYCSKIKGKMSITKTEKGKPCYFPYYSNGELIYACRRSQYYKHKTWCPTTSDFTKDSAMWEYCAPTYPWQKVKSGKKGGMPGGDPFHYRAPAPAKRYQTIDPSATCSPHDDVCVITLIVEEKITMVGNKQIVTLNETNGKLYDPKNNVVSPEKVIVADSYFMPRKVIVVNGTMPGPELRVYEGQKLIINIANTMFSDATTIHWHGLHSRGSPYFDGAGFVNMCPILPNLIVTASTIASPAGTHWYHAHVGFQMGDGLFGPLIVLKKSPQKKYDGEHTLMLSVWNNRHGANEWFLYDKEGSEFIKDIFPKQYPNLGQVRNFDSALINGRGRRQDTKSGTTLTWGPLTIFKVVKGKTYLFRIIGSQADKEFTVSFNNHKFKIVASDGAGIAPIEVTSLIVGGGERYDIELTADQPIANYWVHGKSKKAWYASAILRYEGAPNADPSSASKNCSSTAPCMKVNCDFETPTPAYTACLNYDKIYSHPAVAAPELTPDSPADLFLNFAEPGYGTDKVYSINGFQFVLPKTSILSDPNSGLTFCDPLKCGSQKTCACTHHYHLRKNSVIQMVIMSMGKGRGTHPIHLHGHYFSVLKIGLPRLDAKGKNIGDNEDVVCDGPIDPKQTFCNQAKWRNPTWGGDNIPGLNKHNPPQKDTLLIPKGGYAVVRFKADNPGVWFLHCHIEEHLAGGMALVFLEAQEEWNVPKSFPTCGLYTPLFLRDAAKKMKQG